MAQVEVNTKKVIDRLTSEGWVVESGSKHDKFSNPAHTFKIMVPRHRTLTPGVARSIAKAAGWI